jgi:anion-transporting  ArsA/GET3 family ATPase
MLDTLTNSRVVLVTGKGGVGKTTVAAALACKAAARGRRVLLTELAMPGDDYSPLAGLFGLHRFDREKQELLPGLHGVVLLAQVGHRYFFESVLRSAALTRAALASKAIQRLLASAPSGREIGLFIHLLALLDEKRADGSDAHDLIVVDMPATGHALALTSLPHVLLRLFKRGPVDRAVKAYCAHIHNPDVTRAYVVSLAENLPVSEALDLIAGLEQTQIRVGGVIVNRAEASAWADADVAALIPLLRDRQVLGRESFFQMVAARQAISRLRRSVAVPLFQIPLCKGPEILSQMQRSLEAPAMTGSR